MKHLRNPLKVDLYQDKQKQWRIRLIRSGKIIFITGESYTRKRGAINALDATLGALMEGNTKYNF